MGRSRFARQISEIVWVCVPLCARREKKLARSSQAYILYKVFTIGGVLRLCGRSQGQYELGSNPKRRRILRTDVVGP